MKQHHIALLVGAGVALVYSMSLGSQSYSVSVLNTWYNQFYTIGGKLGGYQ